MATINEYVTSIVDGINRLHLDDLADNVREEIGNALSDVDELIHSWADGDPYGDDE